MAKTRINVRFAPDLWAGIQAAVKRGRARDATDALEQAAAAWLGVEREPVAPVDTSPGPRRQVKAPNGKAARPHRTVTPVRSGASRAVKAGVRPIPKAASKRGAK